MEKKKWIKGYTLNVYFYWKCGAMSEGKQNINKFGANNLVFIMAPITEALSLA